MTATPIHDAFAHERATTRHNAARQHMTADAAWSAVSKVGGEFAGVQARMAVASNA